MLERLAAEVIPVVRKAAPTTLCSDRDPYGGRPAAHGRTSADAAVAMAPARSARARLTPGGMTLSSVPTALGDEAASSDTDQ